MSERLTVNPLTMPAGKSVSPPKTMRTVRACTEDGVAQEGAFCSNEVKTAHYDWITFLPVNLFYQFQRVANLYFLLIGSLQLVPGLSPTEWWTTLGPLMLVLAINAAKEIYDDYFRHKSDAEVNSRLVERQLPGGKPSERVPWRDVKVGDILIVKRGEEIPSDLIMLSAEGDDGLAYVETANLDGETNLKVKSSLAPTRGSKTVADLTMLKGTHIECELPNNQLYKFEGAWVGLRTDDGRAETGMSVDNILLRGSTLRNVSWAMGVVIFTGNESKLMKNMVETPQKVSQLERNMNRLVMGIFATMGVVALLLACGQEGHVQANNKNGEEWYLKVTGTWPDVEPKGAGAVFTLAVTWIIVLNQLIPLSLYVTLEMVKVFQCAFIVYDRELYHAETDTRANVRTTTLNEELGQVSYVLSDKTGTLTQNVMAFVKCSILGTCYAGTEEPGNVHIISNDEKLKRALAAHDAAGDAARVFWESLAVCHTVVPATDDNGELIYQASSPDEEALVAGAAQLGRKLISNVNNKITVATNGKEEVWDVLAVNEFNSTRKRMSVVVRDPRTGSVRLILKGADSVLLERLAPMQAPGVLEATKENLDEYARGGFRTLVLAGRDISPAEYETWSQVYHEASCAVVDRDDKLAEAAEQIERDCVIIGATAVEDKLQDGVPEAIETLLTAGMSVWVLTGDKLETAVAIAMSCNLLREDQNLIFMQERDVQENCSAFMAEAIKNAMADGGKEGDFGLVVEGGALTHILASEQCQEYLLQLCDMCSAVVCCRVSPLQKAEVTTLVKGRTGKVTLGIGDGANDVGMIKAAHIGIGISGREGRAAVLASDYSLAQFRFLVRLLLVHGRWSYKRNKDVVMYAFYKNVTYTMANFYFAFYNAFSAQPVYSAALIATYNVCWTSFPTIVVACFDQDVKPASVARYPQLYMETQKDDARRFYRDAAGWYMLAFWHSVCCYFPALYTIGNAQEDGKARSVWLVGVLCYTSVVITVNLKLAMRTANWVWLNHFFLWLSILVWLAFIPWLSSFWTSGFQMFPDLYGMDDQLYPSGGFWLTIMMSVSACLTPDFTFDAVCRMVYPSDYMLVQEMEKYTSSQVEAPAPRKVRASSIVGGGRKSQTKRHGAIELIRVA